MSKADKKAIFQNLFEVFSSDIKELEKQRIHLILSDELKKCDCIIYDYLPYVEKKSYKDEIAHVDKLSFEECCAWLTFRLRSIRWADTNLIDYVKDGSIQALLRRACEILATKD